MMCPNASGRKHVEVIVDVRKAYKVIREHDVSFSQVAQWLLLENKIRSGEGVPRKAFGQLMRVRRERQVLIPSYDIQMNKPQQLQLGTCHLFNVSVLETMFSSIMATQKTKKPFFMGFSPDVVVRARPSNPFQLRQSNTLKNSLLVQHEVKWTRDSTLKTGACVVVGLMMRKLANQNKVPSSLSGNSAVVARQSQGKICKTETMDRATQKRHLNMIAWLHRHRSEGCTTQAMTKAASFSFLEVVNWFHLLRSEGCWML
ncbi:hypothetical protein PHMEG_00033039 [Phytophthora megakarya]|uniref:Uncharacterized protein n=1 Tax=Phytophthora megakarya TaxID=4795 RepID=A0A225UVP4_9STRA|nr:hypothetical protein PHMEG_00033039 [Phytophthora megakarya]